MKTIHKYPLYTIADFVIIDVPRGAKFIYAGVQHEIICLWAIVDTEAPITKRQLRIVGTGHDAGDVSEEKHIGSTLVLNGTFVWHIFDMGEFLQ